MGIKGVTFDWWGTIAVIPARHDEGAMREIRVSRLHELLRGRGLRPDRSALLGAYDRQTELLEATWARQRELEPDEQIREFLRIAGLNSEDRGLVAVVGETMGSAIVARPPALFPDLPQTLQGLASRGLALGLISNTGRSWGRYLTEVQAGAGIGHFFQTRVYSDELRVRKPDPRIFAAALQGLRLRPEEVVHVGDDVVADVAGAKAVGMRAVWFNTGFWKGAKTDRADAEIRAHADLPPILEKWR